MDLTQAYERGQRAIGKTSPREFLGVVRSVDIERFALAAGDENPAYRSESTGRDGRIEGMVAPPVMLSAIMEWGRGVDEWELLEDGTPGKHFATEVLGGLRLMGGGQDLTFGKPVQPGTEVWMEREFTDVQRREGRSGEFLMVSYETRYLDEGGELLVACRESIIGR